MEVVVSRYSDDLSWLPALAGLLNANITVYCKARARGGEDTARVWPRSTADSALPCALRQESPAPPPVVACTETLANVGNEGHSYLHHMVVRYDSLAPVTLFLPDTIWNDPTQQKPHYTHDVVAALLASRGRLAFADMHWPDTPLRFAQSRLKELVQGFKFPCADRNVGSRQCRWDGTSGANPLGGALVPAEPNDFLAWMRVHAHTTLWDMLACGWSFRGVFAASRGAIRSHEVGLYDHLRGELAKAKFPMAGMYQERLWRRLFLCSARKGAE